MFYLYILFSYCWSIGMFWLKNQQQQQQPDNQPGKTEFFFVVFSLFVFNAFFYRIYELINQNPSSLDGRYICFFCLVLFCKYIYILIVLHLTITITLTTMTHIWMNVKHIFYLFPFPPPLLYLYNIFRLQFFSLFFSGKPYEAWN